MLLINVVLAFVMPDYFESGADASKNATSTTPESPNISPNATKSTDSTSKESKIYRLATFLDTIASIGFLGLYLIQIVGYMRNGGAFSGPNPQSGSDFRGRSRYTGSSPPDSNTKSNAQSNTNTNTNTDSGPSFNTKKGPSFFNSAQAYKILGLSRGASDSAIKKAYHKLALRFHPDKNNDSGAKDKFQEISNAYSLLKELNEKNK
eukprot:NODE_781_length_3919_cov_1.323037.p4 type:complete len:206 gc:universal NODE_781_length_3919_cov_1.323037:3374-2757(-)